MRVVLPELKDQKALFSYLKSNRKSLIAQKCSSQIKSENFDYGCISLKANSKDKIGSEVTKSFSVKAELRDDEIQVDAIANMAGWADSYMDVLIPDCWDRTIKEKGASNKQLIYHLKNHDYSTDAIIGSRVQMRSEYMDLATFNIKSDIKQGQALIGNSIVKKKYDEKCFHLYSDDEIKQHSIGLRYIKIFLCMNSDEEDHSYEKGNWDKYYKYVINKDTVDSAGFFWAVTEIKLVEYSAVLYGANELTTVQETSKNIEENEPSKDTHGAEQEPVKTIQDETSEVDFFKQIKI
ncbi:hypothetical protein ACJRPK_13870 [Aquimarina sp. 2-A2]|uniref:hypothetical protein n=1 Tax=Aquimarina sp. 2-A2 TaxID=3382644 RepID=UPI00387F34FA